MKFILSLFVIGLSFTSLAHTETLSSVESKKNANITTVVDYDRGKRKNRKNRRMNKKRKRKCNQWGRRAYAG